MAARPKPPLPPRTAVSASSSNPNRLSPGVSPSLNSSPYSGGLQDPRASSTQSLRPVESRGANRRTLLLIYIHGFLGAETSFQSFPAHVHNLLTPALAETHVVYTKIYPRYKSRKNISFARDDFSNWLAPHESSTTDIILVGHSLGGILAAEVVLIPSTTSPGNENLFKHRILGLIAFDTPFLGMHPGVIGTGIASLFRAPPQPPASLPPDPEMFPNRSPQDPTYNPTYENDMRLADRTGKLERFWYFWNKHCGELAKATGDYISSHLEFGCCLADYTGLKRRYHAIRPLEDVDETAKGRAPDGMLLQRVRFVNFYSASTGPVKERSPSPSRSQIMLAPPANELQPSSERRSSAESLHPSTASSPRLSLEEHRDGEVITKDIIDLSIDSDPPELTPATTASEQTTSSVPGAGQPSLDASTELGLPPLASVPKPPQEFDPDQDFDEDILKLLRKEHDRKVKAYERAVKEREDSKRDRERLLEKRQRQALKEQAKSEKQIRAQDARVQKEQNARAEAVYREDDGSQQLRETETKSIREKKQKDRKFCALPPKDPVTGMRDVTWVRVYFEGIDEVTAHTSMFNLSETYAKTVQCVVERIETWIAEDASMRMTLADRQ